MNKSLWSRSHIFRFVIVLLMLVVVGLSGCGVVWAWYNYPMQVSAIVLLSLAGYMFLYWCYKFLAWVWKVTESDDIGL